MKLVRENHMQKLVGIEEITPNLGRFVVVNLSSSVQSDARGSAACKRRPAWTRYVLT